MGFREDGGFLENNFTIVCAGGLMLMALFVFIVAKIFKNSKAC